MSNQFAFPATLTEGVELTSVTAFNPNSDKPIYQADSNHPHWDSILNGLRSGDPNVWSLFDVAGGIMVAFQQVSERISYDGKNVLFDGDPIHSVLSRQLERALHDGDASAYTALARFWEKLESNPNPNSRAQAYDWLSCHEFQITEDGDVVGYKGVSSSGENHIYTSTWSSEVSGKPSAYVDGKPIPELSVVPNPIGSVVSMPRSEVNDNPRVACSRGLHVSTKSFADSYGDVTLEVHVNPRDICSVPKDSGGQKVRVNRYKVVGVFNRGDKPGTTVLRKTQDDNTSSWVGWNPNG